MRRLLAMLFVSASLAAPAAAHRLAPSLLDLREVDGGRVEVLWKTPLSQPRGADLRPVLPESCRAVSEPRASVEGTGAVLRWTADCSGGDLVGSTLSVQGLRESGTDALVRVAFLDGRRAQSVLSGSRDSFTVPARPARARVAREYAALGVEHILTGLDHLLFVLGLVLLVRGGRRLLWTVTAFTVGHSITLSLAALGFVAFPTALVEIAIAASIWLLAVEIARGEGAQSSPLRRRPWLFAGSFGLLHGLGFAGALAEIGLPVEEIPAALLSFNVGIELGQLVFVAVVLAVRSALARPLAVAPAWLARAPVYAIGSLGAFFCFERIAGLL